MRSSHEADPALLPPEQVIASFSEQVSTTLDEQGARLHPLHDGSTARHIATHRVLLSEITGPNGIMSYNVSRTFEQSAHGVDNLTLGWNAGDDSIYYRDENGPVQRYNTLTKPIQLDFAGGHISEAVAELSNNPHPVRAWIRARTLGLLSMTGLGQRK